MRTPRIRQLLQQHESTTLDFKRDQYRLTTDEEKGEFIKDLLAFANTPRPTDAHIIIGITEAPTPPHTITGITDKRFDHHLQELVNSKLNRPITFSYETHHLDGHTIGIITIKRQQHPPHHLTKDFSRLTKNTVYVRRGSSTGIATPDEITSLTRPTRHRPSTRGTKVQPLSLTVMHREDEIIVGRGARGIPGFSYQPPTRQSFKLGQYVRLDAKLLITPSNPLVLVSALSTASITTADTRTIPVHRITFDDNADTIDVTTAIVITIRGEERVQTDVLHSSHADGITITIRLATARADVLEVQERLAWNASRQTFTTTPSVSG